MSPFVEAARARYLSGELFAACGDRSSALGYWQAAASMADAYPHPHVAFGWQALRRLGIPVDADARARLETALRAWERRLVIGTNFPGPNACGRGLLLRALGREDEARARFKEVLLLPDQLMSHYLAREALAGTAATAMMTAR